MRAMIMASIFALAGCSGYTPSTVQFSDDSLAFPDNYQIEAARVVQQRGADRSTALVSRP